MSQPLLTESPEKTKQRVDQRQSTPDSARSVTSQAHPILNLQRTLGNQRVAQLIKAKRLTPQGKIAPLQPKLTVGAADDQYEQEADRIARQVVSMPDSVALAPLQQTPHVKGEVGQPQTVQSKPLPLAASITPFVQRKTEPGEVKTEEEKDKEDEKDELLQGKLFDKAAALPFQRLTAEEEKPETALAKSPESLTDSFEAGAEVESRLNQSKGQGSPLPDHVRSYMEPRFGVDFSQVRVHTGSESIKMNRNVGAQAFTNGSDIYYGAGSSPTNLELTAHELTHVVQQTGGMLLQPKRVDETSFINTCPTISRARPACRASKEKKGPKAFSSISSGCSQTPVLLPSDGAANCPTAVNFSFTEPAHVPHCGGRALRATTNIRGVTWSLTSGTAAVDPGSTIATNGTINLATTQDSGDINARATASAPAAGGCHFERPFTIRSHPVGIASTSFVSAAAAGNYGGTFDHVFDSADGNVASLENVGVGERFTNVPNPAAATHNIVAPLNPFGEVFTLSTATLTPGATNNWFLTAAGGLGGTLDSVTIDTANINVGRFVQSASNPTPPRGLPASMTLLQRLHWFCPQRPAANRWIGFVTVPHSRTLRNVGGTIEFVTAVNGVEQPDNYVGPTAVSNLTATPTSTPRSAAPPTGGAAAPPARTVAIKVDTLPAALPAGQIITWSIIGNARGCTIAQDPADDHAAILTIGTTAGTVIIEAEDSTGVNRARVAVVIT